MPVVWLAVRAAGVPGQQDRGKPLAVVAAVDSTGGRREVRCWSAGSRPAVDAVQADAAVVDPSGPARRVSLQLFGRGRAPLFDDPAVQYALRSLAAARQPGDGPLTALTRDPVHYAGSLLVWDAAGSRPPGGSEALRALGPMEVLDIEAGLLSPRPQILHGTQREGGQPWPAASWR